MDNVFAVHIRLATSNGDFIIAHSERRHAQAFFARSGQAAVVLLPSRRDLHELGFTSMTVLSFDGRSLTVRFTDPDESENLRLRLRELHDGQCAVELRPLRATAV